MNNLCPAVCPGVCPTGTTYRTSGVPDAVPCWVQNQNQNQTVLKQFCCSFFSRSKIIIRLLTRDAHDDFSLSRHTNHTPSAVVA